MPLALHPPSPARQLALRAGDAALRGAAGLAIAVAAAAVAAAVVLLAVGSVENLLGRLALGAGTYTRLAILGFVMALAWVWGGAQAARTPRQRAVLAGVLFAAGDYTAAGLLWDAAPCAGAAELAAAGLGGGVGSVLAGAAARAGVRRPRRATRAAALLLTAAALAVAGWRAWAAPAQGDLAYVHLAGDRLPVWWTSVGPRGAAGPGARGARVLVAWADGDGAAAVTRAAAAGPVAFEGDVGSGRSPARLVAVPAAAARGPVGRAVVAQRRAQLRDAVRDGTAPRFCAAVGVRAPDLTGARFFRISAE